MKIRPMVLCLFEHGDRFLMQEFRHDFGEPNFYRLPGGGIDLGETAAAAVRREVREELQSEIADVQLVEVIENIFEYGGELRHEIAFLFRARLLDKALLSQDFFEFFDNGLAFRAEWVSRAEIVAGARVIYPVRFREMVLAGEV